MILFLFAGHDGPHEFVILFLIFFGFHGCLYSQFFKIFFLPFFTLFLFTFDDIGIECLTILANGKFFIIIHGDLDGFLTDNLLFFIVEVFDIPVLKSLFGRVSIIGVEYK